MIDPKDQQEAEFIAKAQTWKRADLLRLMRFGGFTAHRLRGEELIRAAVMLRRRAMADLAKPLMMAKEMRPGFVAVQA